MSKRRRVDGQTSEFSLHSQSPAQNTITYEMNEDLRTSPSGAKTPPGPYSYTAERRQAQPDQESQNSHSRKSNSYGANNGKKSRMDPQFGQVSAFGLGGDEEGEDGEGISADALKYLKSVRSEAEVLPRVVTAPKKRGTDISQGLNGHKTNPRSHHINSHADYVEADENAEAGWYEDGAYIARPLPQTQSSDNPSSDPQTAYYTALQMRFATHRARLRHAPPSNAIAALSSAQQPTTLSTSHHSWRTLFRTESPSPTQLCAMEPSTALNLLPVIDEELERCADNGRNIDAVTSQWIWGLLGRCEDAGQMSGEEVAVVRDLAKTAGWVSVRYRKMNLRESNAGLVQGGGDDAEMQEVVDVEDDRSDGAALEARKTQMLLDLAQGRHADQEEGINLEDEIVEEPVEVPDINTRATLDLIITVAAEFYGQRDLLASRLPWDA